MSDEYSIFKNWPVAALAAFGGAVRYISVAPKRLSWRMLAIEITLAVFAGVLVSLLIAPFGLSEQITAAAAALGGYSAKAVLFIIENAFLKKIRKETDSEDNP